MTKLHSFTNVYKLLIRRARVKQNKQLRDHMNEMGQFDGSKFQNIFLKIRTEILFVDDDEEECRR